MTKVDARVVVIAVAFLALVSCSSSGGSSTASTTAGPTGGVVWPAPPDAIARAQAAGLPALPAEAFAMHIHVHLDVYVNGVAVVVPAAVGIDLVNSRITPLHTHDSSGIIHIESGTVTTFTLGQFFTEWGVRLGGGCVDRYCSPQTSIALVVNGAPSSIDPAALPLHAHDEIALIVGPGPPSLPASFKFTGGL